MFKTGYIKAEELEALEELEQFNQEIALVNPKASSLAAIVNQSNFQVLPNSSSTT